jgi:hypothetical protein
MRNKMLVREKLIMTINKQKITICGTKNYYLWNKPQLLRKQKLGHRKKKGSGNKI